MDSAGSVSFDRIARIARRRFSAPGGAAVQIPLVLVALEPHHPPRAAEHVGLFRLRHRDLRMLVEIEMQARRAAFGGADYEHVRQAVRLHAAGLYCRGEAPTQVAGTATGGRAR